MAKTDAQRLAEIEQSIAHGHSIRDDVVLELVAALRASLAECESKDQLIHESFAWQQSYFTGEPMADGDYAHILVCSASRKKPAGGPGCVCKPPSLREARSRVRELEAECERLTRENAELRNDDEVTSALLNEKTAILHGVGLPWVKNEPGGEKPEERLVPFIDHGEEFCGEYLAGSDVWLSYDEDGCTWHDDSQVTWWLRISPPAAGEGAG